MIWCKTDVKNWNYYEITRLWCHESNWRPHRVELVILLTLSFFYSFSFTSLVKWSGDFGFWKNTPKSCALASNTWMFSIWQTQLTHWHMSYCGHLRCITVLLVWNCQCEMPIVPWNSARFGIFLLGKLFKFFSNSKNFGKLEFPNCNLKNHWRGKYEQKQLKQKEKPLLILRWQHWIGVCLAFNIMLLWHLANECWYPQQIVILVSVLYVWFMNILEKGTEQLR